MDDTRKLPYRLTYVAPPILAAPTALPIPQQAGEFTELSQAPNLDAQASFPNSRPADAAVGRDLAGHDVVDLDEFDADQQDPIEVREAFAQMYAASTSPMMSKAKRMVATIVLIGVLLALSPLIFKYVMNL